jgi:hypothetical protein
MDHIIANEHHEMWLENDDDKVFYLMNVNVPQRSNLEHHRFI